MPNPNAVGTANFKVNGVAYNVAGDFSVMALSKKRNVLVGLDGNVAFQEEFVSPMFEGTLRDHADQDIVALMALENATVQLELANGTSWEIGNASYTGEGTLSVREGEVQVRFNGQTIRRLT